MEKLYYVYGLKNPITKSFFYIGKGKGKRYKQHFMNTVSNKNFLKKKRINEILKRGLNVEIIIISSNLTEEKAFELEKTLVHILGREIFGEGILTNIIPGGKWAPGDYLFNLKKSETILPNDSLTIKNGDQILEFKNIRNNNYLNTLNSEQFIYKYDRSGYFIEKINLNEFFKINVFERELKIFNLIRKNDYPIYTNNLIYSKYYFNKIKVSRYKFYKDFEIINEMESAEYDNQYLKQINPEEINQSNNDWEYYIKNFIEKK